jgi:hypothetical protein
MIYDEGFHPGCVRHSGGPICFERILGHFKARHTDAVTIESSSRVSLYAIF